MKLAERTALVSPSFTIGINAKANDLKAQGIKVVNFSAGEPDFSVPEKAKRAAVWALDENKTKYDKVSGLIVLREAVAKKLREENKLEYSAEEIIISNGAKQAIMNALLATLNPGEEILVPVPYWTSYPEIIRLCGAVPVFVHPEDEKDYKITVKDLEKCITSNTKMLMFNNPSNPSGTIYEKSEIEEIARYCQEHDLWILSDEIYERFFFEGDYYSPANISREIWERTIIINGMSKSAAMTGLRIGYTASNPQVAEAISRMQGHLTSHPALVSQYMAEVALNECREEIAAQLNTYKTRRGLVLDELDSLPDITYLKPSGAFYVMINFGAYRDKIPHGDSFSLALCDKLLDEVQVAVVPGIAFGLDDFVRIAYTVSEEDLHEGMSRIRKFLESLK